jgi:hypothetical protein
MRQNITAGNAWWGRIVHFMAAGKQRDEGRGAEVKISPSRACPE